MKRKILVANRGEIAVRILRAAAELNIPTVAVYSEDDTASLHCRLADESEALPQKGVAAYLNIDAMVAAAKKFDCVAIHPGYGFLAENADFARRCESEGILFIGPSADTLALFGDKVRARNLAKKCGLPILPATTGVTSLAQAKNFFTSLGDKAAIMIKAIAGGGGRGMRPVFRFKDMDEAYHLCQSEALAAFGKQDVYAERLITRARHIEVQIVGDGTKDVCHLWERECTIQRKNQKIMEIAPSPSIGQNLRDQLTDAAGSLAKETKYKGLATVEFLVDADAGTGLNAFTFLEVNPRLQVEHTVTEEITGIDLVKAQIQIGFGKSLSDLGLLQKQIKPPTGFAVQLRINMEEIDKNGDIRPSCGTLTAFSPPLGPGVRVDTFGYPGYVTCPAFDSLLAKLICCSRSSNYADVLKKASRALREFQINGVKTNISLLQNLLIHPDVKTNKVTTRFVEDHIKELTHPTNDGHTTLFCNPATPSGAEENSIMETKGPENTHVVHAPMLGTIVSLSVSEGDLVHQGQSIAVMEAMKMHHIVEAHISGIVRMICAGEGDTLVKGQAILFIEPKAMDISAIDTEKSKNPDDIRPDLEAAIERHRIGQDEARPDAVEKRRKTAQRTARENIADLVDPNSFIEYGALAVAAQRRRKSLDDLIKKSPADGLITGIGSVNAELFDADRSRCMVMSYDYTVMAGTQGAFNHMKTDRMLGLAEELRLPLVLFAEGGGGRPGDVDIMDLKVAGLDLDTFTRYARLSGLVPLVGIVSGRCFAGNATLLGCSDVIIATQNSNIGMGGPAMIEGGGLGKCRPEDIGPVDIQSTNGVIDIVVEDEAKAVQTAKKYLSYFQGPLSEWECADQRQLRQCIPENRLLAYDIRNVITSLSDTDSVLELREAFGSGIITAFIRIEGTAFGLMANNTLHLGGAIDADAADKASRFIQLCDAFDIPLITLSDTPGFMVGPEAEKSAQVRHFARMFVTAAGATIPVFSIILRKGYGLGAMAMVGGGYHRPVFNVSWPTGEFGGMGLEGAVRLGFKKELDAAKNAKEQKDLFDSLVKMAYDHGKAINMASFLEIDDVIDPKDTRRWITCGARSLPPVVPRTGKKRPNIDTW
ncbi:MAG: ATP-grasp domain-containing protein [Desulfobacteraceae bacterium]|nr:ATP-grasp domain-containing protein [Desulfobacteraceae bacterium]